jgi:hypothetical protein
MSDFTAVQLEARTLPEELAAGWLEDAKSFIGGLLFTVLVAVAGAALVTVALVVGVVGAPVIAAVVAFAVVRSRRAARAAWMHAET